MAEQPIEGPFHTGPITPAMLGWAVDELGGIRTVLKERDRLWRYFRELVDLLPKQVGARSRAPIWEYSKRLNGGKHLPTGYQETGDCVSWGVRQAGHYRHCWEIAGNMEEEVFRPWFAPWIYGTSRADIGGNRLRGAGSVGAWAAAAIQKYGILFDDDDSVPAYSGQIADKWGYGPPKQFYATAADNLVEGCSQLTSVAEIRDCLNADEPGLVTIASSQGWAMQPVVYKEHHVFRMQGSFNHQTCLIEWMDDPFPATYRLNSWGANAHGTPLNGEPPGGAWNRAEDLEREIKSRSVELYYIKLFKGNAGPPDNRIVR